MTAYYNEIDPYAAAWLRNLIAAGHIAPGEVDERSIVDVRPDDLRGFGQCHFFAGIGGWSYALRLAGIPDDLPIWSGSCPCQPFSVAGAKRGCEDERHLWPAFFNLIRECRPATVFGEQVAGAAGFAWYDLVAADLEGEDYAAAAADIGAHSVGAPHIRQRLYWVAHSNEGERGSWRPSPEQQTRSQLESARRSSSSIVAYSKSRGLGQGSPDVSRGDEGTRAQGSGMRFTNDGGSILGNACGEGLERREQRGARDNERHRTHAHGPTTESGSALDPWSDIEWIHCSDGKARPTKPGIFPLLFDGVSGRVAVGSAIQQTYRTLSEEEAAHLFNRVGVLRGSGNAIVPQLAAVFVRAAFGYTE